MSGGVAGGVAVCGGGATGQKWRGDAENEEGVAPVAGVALIDRFVAAALASNVQLDLMTHPTGEHGFDIANDDQRSREILQRTLGFLREQLDN